MVASIQANPIDSFEHMFDHVVMLPTLASPPDADARAEVLQRLRAKIAAPRPRPTRVIPVPEPLAALFPGGGLRPGATYALASGGSLLLSLLAAASASGSWCAVVGVPELGAEAAELAGLDLDRLVLVPTPGERWLGVLSALAEVVPVLVIRPGGRVRDSDAARLGARLRDREAVLLSIGEWPQSDAVVSLDDSTWSGVDDGHGYLTMREARITVAARRDPVPRSARLLIPGPNGRLAETSLPAERLRAVG